MDNTKVVALVEQARTSRLTLFERDGDLVVRGPRSQEALALELLANMGDVLLVIQPTSQDFISWMQGMWIEASRPTWRTVLVNAMNSGDQARAKFARHMIVEVLGDDPNA